MKYIINNKSAPSQHWLFLYELLMDNSKESHVVGSTYKTGSFMKT